MVDGPRTPETRDGFGHFHVFLQLAYLAQTLKRQLRDAFGSKVIQK